jgi:hypothetical protein
VIAQRIGGFVVGLLLLSSCGIGSSGSGVSHRSSLDHQLLGVPVSVDFRPEVHGLSFPNFDNRAYLQSFDAHALVSVLGTGPRICVDGTVGEPVEEGWLMEGSDQPCEVTPEAAEFIEMVESARVAGHEVLPYAITYPRENLARIAVYDSNWPGVERFIALDLRADTWRFSFGGDDPETDPFAWEGTHEDLGLNSIQVRIDALEARGVSVTRPTN